MPRDREDPPKGNCVEFRSGGDAFIEQCECCPHRDLAAGLERKIETCKGLVKNCVQAERQRGLEIEFISGCFKTRGKRPVKSTTLRCPFKYRETQRIEIPSHQQSKC